MADVTVGENFSYTDPSTYIPTIFDVGRKALTGKPSDQIIASMLIATAAIATSYLSLGATLLIAFPALALAFIGFVRLFWCMVR